jgi:hypothetical protein
MAALLPSEVRPFALLDDAKFPPSAVSVEASTRIAATENGLRRDELVKFIGVHLRVLTCHE